MTGTVSLTVIVALFVPVAVALPVTTENFTDGVLVPVAVALTLNGTPTSGAKPELVLNAIVCGAGAMTRLPVAEPENAGSVIVATIA